MTVLLSPAHSRPGNGQASHQITDKADTTNWSLIDYWGAKGGKGKGRGKGKGKGKG